MSLHHPHNKPLHPRLPPRAATANLAVLLLCGLLIAWTRLSPAPLPEPPALSVSAHNAAAAQNAAVARNAAAQNAAARARRARPLPPCADGSRARTFLIVFMGHSGSSAILSELRAHSQVYIEIGELVDHQPVFNTSEALRDTRAFFERGIRAGKTPGFKIRPMHIIDSPARWRALAAEFGTRILWQYRQNFFKATVGEYSYRVLNDTSVVEGFLKNVTKKERCNIGAGCTFRIKDFGFLHRTLKNKLRSQNQITRAVHEIAGEKGCVREVPYEDYLYEREETVADIQRFLGLKRESTLPGRFKATGDSMCDVVENWQEVCKLFYGCVVWQHMLDDVRNQCFCTYSGGPSTYCTADDPMARPSDAKTR